MTINELMEHVKQHRLNGDMELVVRIETGAAVPVLSLSVIHLFHMGGECLLISNMEDPT